MDRQRYEELFLTESREHVSAINHHLLELEQGGGGANAESVSAVFRAVHTIKGMSATMGYAAVAELSHELETVLDSLRGADRGRDAGLLDLLFQSADLLESAIEAAVAGRDGGVATKSVIDRLRSAVTERAHTDVVAAPRGQGVLVRVQLAPDTPLRGVRAFMAVNAARAFGEVTAIEPSLDNLESESFGRDFALRIVTDAEAAVIAEAVRRVGDIAAVAVGEDGVAHILGTFAADRRRGARGGRASTAVSADVIAAAAPIVTPRAGTRVVPVSPGAPRRLIRVDLRRLDNLMNVVGELVITRGRLLQIASEHADGELESNVNEASRLIGELRDEITATRMVPVWQVFDRFPRMVRDTARQLGKEVDFHLEGRDIELDRSMLDEVADSLVHLLRNAIDHGLEPADARVAAGKPPIGRLVLSAARERSAAVIRVTDDGRGINRARVLERAKAEGLVDASRTDLSDDELVRLLTRPGFSTAERVTDVSGRGVGIDAVHTRVRSLGGAIDIKSVDGQGTSVMLRLPLTLAIVRAVLARVGPEIYAIPAAHVSETVELTPDIVVPVQEREFVRVRDDVLPLVRLRSLFSLPAVADDDATMPQQIVVLDLGDRRAALVMDDLVGQEEIVVKQFDAVRDGLPYFGGATLLADGTPALIIDVSTLG